MSKVQVDTIVDKDDISAPTLSKGAIVTGVCTATSFDGAISEWVLGADGTSHYTFTGSGLTGAENDPTLYLKRGQKYRFKNSSGGHPFRIQSTANGSAGTAYNDGVTNNDAGDGTTLEWDVQFDAPSVLYYQCTAHGNMGGKIYIGNSGNSSTLVDLNVSGVTTTGIATVTTSVVVGSAVTANSDGVITSGIITATSFAGDGSALTGITQTTINNNANNLLITGSGTANTLEAESQLTYDGTNFQLKKTGSSDYNEIIQDANPSSENGTLGYLSGYWNTERVADIRFAAGDDTSNKNNAQICFRTTNEGQGNVTDRLRIGNFGQIGLPVGPVGTAATDWGASGQVLTSGGSSASPTWATPSGGAWEVESTILFNGSMTDGFTDLKNWSNSYAQYKVILQNVNFSSGVVVWFRVFTDNTTGANGTLNSSADYMYGAAFGSTSSSGGWSSAASSSQNQHVLAGDNAYSTWNGEYTFPMNPSNGTHEHVWIGQSYVDSNGFWFYDNGSTSNSDNHLTGVRIFWDGGSVGVPQNGRVTVLKMKYS